MAFLQSAGVFVAGGGELDQPPLVYGHARRPWMEALGALSWVEEPPSLLTLSNIIPQPWHPGGWAQPRVPAPPVQVYDLTDWNIMSVVVPVILPPVTGTGPFFGTVPVAGGPGPGAALYVGMMGPKKFFQLAGVAPGLGNFKLKASMDGNTYSTIASLSYPLANSQEGDQVILPVTMIFQYVRVDRDGSGGSPFIGIGGAASSSS